MRCPSCNREIPDDAKFCPYCGAKISKEGTSPTGNLGELLVISGPHEGDRFKLSTEGVIGRDPSRADYTLYKDRYVSRRHAKIEMRNGEVFLMDLGSTNGSYVLSEDMKSWRKIQPGVEVKLSHLPFKVGNTVLLVRSQGGS